VTLGIKRHIYVFILLKNIYMLQTSLSISHISQVVSIVMYVCAFDWSDMLMSWVLANNVCIYRVRCRRAPADAARRTPTPQECALTSTPMLTLRCAHRSRYSFLQWPAQEHHVWRVVAYSLWQWHAHDTRCNVWCDIPTARGALHRWLCTISWLAPCWRHQATRSWTCRPPPRARAPRACELLDLRNHHWWEWF